MNFKKKGSVTIQLFENTQILYYQNFIILKGKRGSIAYLFRDPQRYSLIVKTNKIFIFDTAVSIKPKSQLLRLVHLVKSLMFGVHFFFSKKLSFVGVGLRCWLKSDKNKKKVLLIKVGFSEDICIFVPKTVSVFCLRPTLILIRGLNKERVHQFASLIRSHKKPDSYRGRGIQYSGEIITLKTGKKK